jgi:hypothetical protein
MSDDGETVRALAEYVLAAICVIAAVVVFVAQSKPESEVALIGIAGAAVGAVLRGRSRS